jgi:hypothetical protein
VEGGAVGGVRAPSGTGGGRLRLRRSRTGRPRWETSSSATDVKPGTSSTSTRADTGLDLPLSTSLHTRVMEGLEIVLLAVILIAALILGAIWTATVVHWLRSTDQLS